MSPGTSSAAFGGEAVADVPRPDLAVEPVSLGRERGLAELDLVQPGLGQHPDMAVVVHGEIENMVVAQPALTRVITETRRLDAGCGRRGVTGVGPVALEECSASRAKPDPVRHALSGRSTQARARPAELSRPVAGSTMRAPNSGSDRRWHRSTASRRQTDKPGRLAVSARCLSRSCRRAVDSFGPTPACCRKCGRPLCP